MDGSVRMAMPMVRVGVVLVGMAHRVVVMRMAVAHAGREWRGMLMPMV